MSQFEIHEIEDAPEAARPLLEGVQAKTGGFLPNLYKGLAEAPQALNAYLTLSDLLAKTSLSAQEQQVVLLAASIENNCHYCVAAHSSGARMAKVDKEEIALLRRGEPVGEPRLQALRLFTEAVVRERGHVSDHLAAFREAGYTRAQALEVVMAVAMKTLSNYANHIIDTPLDDLLERMAWKGKSES